MAFIPGTKSTFEHLHGMRYAYDGSEPAKNPVPMVIDPILRAQAFANYKHHGGDFTFEEWCISIEQDGVVCEYESDEPAIVEVPCIVCGKEATITGRYESGGGGERWAFCDDHNPGEAK